MDIPENVSGVFHPWMNHPIYNPWIYLAHVTHVAGGNPLLFRHQGGENCGKNWDFEQEKRLISMEYHGDRLGIQWNTCRLLWRLGLCFFFVKVSEKNFLLWVVLLEWEMKKSKQDLGLELWAFPRSTRFRKDGWFATTAISGVRNGKSKPYPISHPPVPFPAMHHFWWNDQPLIFSSSHHLFYYKSL